MFESFDYFCLVENLILHCFNSHFLNIIVSLLFDDSKEPFIIFISYYVPFPTLIMERLATESFTYLTIFFVVSMGNVFFDMKIKLYFYLLKTTIYSFTKLLAFYFENIIDFNQSKLW